jgi:hypothetical protein
MPRGYLKHNKGISRKQRRGGSSFNAPWSSEVYGYWERKKIVDLTESDFTLEGPASPRHVSSNEATSVRHVGECLVCFEESPVICLIEQCKWHGGACRKCLHRIYVTEAQKSTENYPLQCFHPQCSNKIRIRPLEQHQIFETPEEKKEHRKMMQYSKNKRRKERTVYCPKCDFPQGIKENIADEFTCLKCKDCKFIFFVSPHYPTFRALQNWKEDSIGINDGWAPCPSCGIYISKGNGCDHMECGYCGHEFWWDDDVVDLWSRLARPPDEEMHLWWE